MLHKSVMITFDDGYLDNWVYAFPVLKRLGLHAHIFLITGQIGDGPARNLAEVAFSHKKSEEKVASGNADDVMLRWSEIEEMQASGLVEFHAHTHTHQRWDWQITDTAERHRAL
ncbi:MAG: polysaccharide deacetylase family protein [Candidatus Malihini olakiniferum]